WLSAPIDWPPCVPSWNTTSTEGRAAWSSRLWQRLSIRNSNGCARRSPSTVPGTNRARVLYEHTRIDRRHPDSRRRRGRPGSPACNSKPARPPLRPRHDHPGKDARLGVADESQVARTIASGLHLEFLEERCDLGD